MLEFVRTDRIPGCMKSTIDRPLSDGIDALTRAAAKSRARAASFTLREPPEALARGAILIAIASARGLVLKLVKARPELATASRATEIHLEEFARRLAEIDLLAGEIAESVRHPTAAPPMTQQEEDVLKSGDLDIRPLGAAERPLLQRATAEYARLLSESYTVPQTAHLLAVNTSRIRQRLTGTPRTLYGIKLGKSWRIPKFQFQRRGLVPGIQSVIARLAPDLHPVAVHRWFTSPHPDLLSADESALSPLDWLRVGNPPDAVAELAADL